MIEKTITDIEEKIGSAESVTPERKAELLKLLGTLKTEVTELAKTHGEQAISIAGFAKLSAHEAMRTHQNAELRIQLRNRRHDFIGDLLVNFLEPRLVARFRLGAQRFKTHRFAVFHGNAVRARKFLMCRP
jgi:Mg2+ and Co2+ transporter CorA